MRGISMETRRHFLKLAFGSVVGGGFFLGPALSAGHLARAADRKVLGKGTTRESLIHENPAGLDTTNLPTTPLEEFRTMGPTTRVVDLSKWRLEVSGLVKKPLSLEYAQLTALPSIEREVLLICPGVFANHGQWKGVSINGLLQQADFDRTATRLVIEARNEKTARFPMGDILADKIFLAYQVNGKVLPGKHGYPLRLVAEGFYGEDWIKYVDKVTVEPR
jgi:DMSO/TMAO reductase YedYZ molybdopterin-dependent catalytic subunit